MAFYICSSVFGMIINDQGAFGPNVQMSASKDVCVCICMCLRKGENQKCRKEELFQAGEFRSWLRPPHEPPPSPLWDPPIFSSPPPAFTLCQPPIRAQLLSVCTALIHWQVMFPELAFKKTLSSVIDHSWTLWGVMSSTEMVWLTWQCVFILGRVGLV